MKKRKEFLILSLVFSVLCSFAFGGDPGNIRREKEASPQKLDPETKEAIIEEVSRLIEEKYVFPDMARKIAENIRSKHANKAYDPIEKLPDFLQQVTHDLRAVNDDAHLGVIPRRGPVMDGVSPEEMYKSIFLKRAPFQNYGFKRVERLLGNVGCLVLDEFSYIEMDGENVGGETAESAMKMLSNSYALIIDLRDNFGGREEMALFLLDYFFDEPVHLLNNRYRSREEKEIRTQGENAGSRLSEIPLYVLTSRHTVSGGEMFAFVLKNRKRATIIGEKTRGAAHRTHLFSLENEKIDVAIPVGTTVDPITGTDWEGTGVEPDIEVPSAQAMDVAYKNALETILQANPGESERYEMEWTLMEADARLNPVTFDEAALGEYVGVFGERRIALENGVLIYRREGQPAYELEPMTKDLFAFTDKSMFYVRIKFDRDQSGTVNKMIMVYDTGQKAEFLKIEK